MATSPEQSPSLSAAALSSGQRNLQENVSKRIPRAVISCFTCRQKKLKCDRARPCSNCAKRGISCAYATPIERSHVQNRGGNAQLYSRIRHLESLIATLVTDKRDEVGEAASSQPASSSNQSSSSRASQEDDSSETAENNSSASAGGHQGEYVQDFGRMRMNDSEITYVSSTHWTAIRDDVTSIREYIEAGDGHYDSNQALYEGPSLLLGVSRPSSVDEILSSIPPRSTVDRLVSRFFNSGEPSVLIFHMPTFGLEYDRFWADLHGTPITWISLLFSVMSMGVFFYLRSGEYPPDISYSPQEAIDAFRLRAVECLILGNYIKPKAYTIESLILHTQCEYFNSENAQSAVWVLWGTVVRLSLFVGLHQDPKHFPEISCFDGEMRRRKWALITQLDLLISYQVGLPRMVREGEGDTELPHNLRDEDFDKSSTELPPSRSSRDITPISYSICKGKLSHVLGLIIDQASSVKAPSVETLTELDQKLTESYSSIFPHLQLRSLNVSVTDSPILIMRRYTLDIIYHKACCLLHRRYFDMSRVSNPRYQSSRTRCLDSATQLLKHQAAIHHELQPGGLLNRDQWFASSLMSHDFILAAMIICLELQHGEKRRGMETTLQEGEGNGEMETHSKEELVQALEISYNIWNLSASHSKDAANATEALAFMLRKVGKSIPSKVDSANIHESFSHSMPFPTFGFTAPEGTESSARDEDAVQQNPGTVDFGSNGDEWIPAGQETMFTSIPMPNAEFSVSGTGNLNPGGGADIMTDIDLSTDIDWRLWDSQMQNMGMHPWIPEQEF